jgi:hypothetical protein
MHESTVVRRSEARLFALQLIRDPEYRKNLLKALRARTLAPAVECMLYAYAYDKPPQRLEIGQPGDFEELEVLPEMFLLERARLLVAVMEGQPGALEALAQHKALGQREAERDAQPLTDGVLHEPEEED